MALTKCDVATDVIGLLGTKVEERGLTTQQFKDKFDEMPEGIKTYLNDVLTVEVDAHIAQTQTGATQPHGLAKNKLDATTAPAITDDSADGYSINSVWIDTTNDKSYVCLDATEGAAVWKETTSTTADLAAGNLKFIANYTTSTELAAWDIVFPANARYVKVVVNRIRPVTNSVSFKMQVSDDGGSTFKAGTGYKFIGTVLDCTSDTITVLRSAGADSVTLTPVLTSSTAARDSIVLEFFNTDTAIRPNWTYEAQGAKPTSLDTVFVKGSARYDASMIINAVRIYASSGNIANGNADVYAVLSS